jgi:hypothetical protein
MLHDGSDPTLEMEAVPGSRLLDVGPHGELLSYHNELRGPSTLSRGPLCVSGKRLAVSFLVVSPPEGRAGLPMLPSVRTN